MTAIIETLRLGGGKARELEWRVQELGDEFSAAGIEFRTRIQEEIPPEAILIITVIGWIAQPLIKKLIDKLFEKEDDTKDVRIVIIHRDAGERFDLPEQEQECLDHFKRLE